MTARRRHRWPCPGSGRRVRPTGSTAFPEVKCPECHYWASPVKKYGDHQIRSHRRVVNDPYAEDCTCLDGGHRDGDTDLCLCGGSLPAWRREAS